MPVHLPEDACSRLPLQHRVDARLPVQFSPRQLTDEACPLAAAAQAVVRVMRAQQRRAQRTVE